MFDENYILDDFLMQRSTIKKDEIESVKLVDNGLALIRVKNRGVYEYDYFSKSTVWKKSMDELRAYHLGYDEKSFAKEFGRRLLHKLDEVGMSIYILSEITGISLSQLYRYINGEAVPSLYKAGVIEKHLKCNPGYLNPFNSKF